jgi:hypothetical protein
MAKPLDPYAYNGVDANRLTTPDISSPADIAPAPSLDMTKVNATPPPPAIDPTVKAGAEGLGAGLAAGEKAIPAYDGTSAAVSVGEGILSGAASGAVGGVPGALIGGGVGGIVAGVNAFLSVSAENKRKSDTAALLAEAKARQDAQYNQARQDSVEQLGVDRAALERENTIATNTLLHNRLTETIGSNADLRAKYLKTGVTSGRV